jgi:hypothetical protein
MAQDLLAAGVLFPVGRPIPVCWTGLAAEYEEPRAIVRDAVRDTWERQTDLQFSGWGLCKPTPSAGEIRIEGVRDAEDVSSYSIVGYPSGRDAFTMRLNFRTVEKAVSRLQWRARLYNASIHEFGHALGFDHEQSRQDTPKECLKELAQRGQSASQSVWVPGWLTGQWDQMSIMNYCRPGGWITETLFQLSETDILAARFAYGGGGLLPARPTARTATRYAICSRGLATGFRTRTVAIAGGRFLEDIEPTCETADVVLRPEEGVPQANVQQDLAQRCEESSLRGIQIDMGALILRARPICGPPDARAKNLSCSGQTSLAGFLMVTNSDSVSPGAALREVVAVCRAR